MFNHNKKNITTKVIYFLLLLATFSIAINAEPLKKPTQDEIKKLIKKMLLESKITTFTSIDTYKDLQCKDIKVNKIKILKVGRASSNYYQQSGNYIDTQITIKFTIDGSCNLSTPYRINEDEYNQYKWHRTKIPVMPMDLSGRVPFSDIPFEGSLQTDRYGDWEVNKAPYPFNEEDRAYSESTKKYLENLYHKLNGEKVKTWKKNQAIKSSRMSDDAESGFSVLCFDKLCTKEVKALLLSQPKKLREFICSTYWKLSMKGNRANTDRFLKEVIVQMKLKAKK